MNPNKITVRKDGTLWRVDCPIHASYPRARFWSLWVLAIENAFTHAERDHGSG